MNAESRKPVLVNVGCGSRYHTSWLNYDLHSSAPEVIACDLTKGIPLQSNAADAVYSAAVLEHIRPADVPSFLAECVRVLKPGGLLRIAVPDFEQQVKAYLAELDAAKSGSSAANTRREWMLIEMIDQVGREKSGGGMAAFLSRKQSVDENFIVQRIGEEGRDLVRSLNGRDVEADPDICAPRGYMVRGRKLGQMLCKWLLRSPDLQADLAALEVGRFRLNSGEVHRWVYDEMSLRNCMSAAGLENLTAMPHGQSSIPNWTDYHLEVSPNGLVQKPDLLIVEGVKG
jgi:predicted SAM-dependent methyltransferase